MPRSETMTPTSQECAETGCASPVAAVRRCRRHYRAWVTGVPLEQLLDPAPGLPYKTTMKASKGACQLCHLQGRRQVDHCHRHGTVRGLVCGRCNIHLAYVDTEAGAGLLVIEEYVAYSRRCPACTPDDRLSAHAAQVRADDEETYRIVLAQIGTR